MSQRAWDMIISSIISIAITIVFGYYFIYVGERHREPTFYVDPIRTMIIDKENAADAPLKLLKASNDTAVAINADVVSAYCYFFNQGQETIKRENVYSPVKIKVDTGAEILYFKVIKNSREVSGINIIKDTLDNSLIIDFKALEIKRAACADIDQAGEARFQQVSRAGLVDFHAGQSTGREILHLNATQFGG